jgi:hypothetical protein
MPGPVRGLSAALITVVTVALVLITPANAAPASPFIAYSTNSFFRKPLPTSGVPVASNSGEGIKFVDANDPYDYPRIRGVGSNSWGIGYAEGQCTDPVWKFASSATLPASQAFLASTGFHAPSNFADSLPVNNDSPIVVIDRCGSSVRPSGFTVWGANVRYDGTRVLKSGGDGNLVGGSFEHNSNGLDRRNPSKSSSLNERSRGIIPDSMLIRDDLLAAAEQGANGGTLGHVLEMFWIETDSAAGHVSPMVGHENNKNGWGAEGQRIRVQESWQPPANCTGPGLVIARTLQRYGAYLGDNSGSGSGIKAEQGSTYPGLTQDALGRCIKWTDMQFITPGWGA